MSWQTSKAFVPSEARIARIEAFPLNYGARATGAVSAYKTKDDFPKPSGLIEGGYAKDIYLIKDVKRKRIIIQDDRIFSERDEDFATDANSLIKEENLLLGILDRGLRHDSQYSQADAADVDKVICWYNGIWVIIRKYPKGTSGEDVLIPFELARLIVRDANCISTDFAENTILAGLDKHKIDGSTFESVPAKQLAKLLNSEDLYSYWAYDGVLNIMMNTHMRYGPYKLQRTNRDIIIHMSIHFVDGTKGSGVQKIEGIGSATTNMFNDYVNVVKQNFMSWKVQFEESSYDKFGGAA